MKITRQHIVQFVEEILPDESILLADGLEGAFVGIGQQFNTYVAVYDRDACIRILAGNMGSSEDRFSDAEEYFEYNVVGSNVGPQTPIFLSRIPRPTRKAKGKTLCEVFAALEKSTKKTTKKRKR